MTKQKTDNIFFRTWNAFSSDYAEGYLKTIGNPAVNSKKILLDLLLAYRKEVKILDLGCGNAQLAEFFREGGLQFEYCGVDISEPLLKVAEKVYPQGKFVQDDLTTLERVQGHFDVAVISHVAEMLASPEATLRRARDLADKIMIRFYEPPVFDVDTVELREMEVGGGQTVPCIRRKMSKDMYRLILAKLNCVRADVYKDPFSNDQVHVLHF